MTNQCWWMSLPLQWEKGRESLHATPNLYHSDRRDKCKARRGEKEKGVYCNGDKVHFVVKTNKEEGASEHLKKRIKRERHRCPGTRRIYGKKGVSNNPFFTFHCEKWTEDDTFLALEKLWSRYNERQRMTGFSLCSFERDGSKQRVYSLFTERARAY